MWTPRTFIDFYAHACIENHNCLERRRRRRRAKSWPQLLTSASSIQLAIMTRGENRGSLIFSRKIYRLQNARDIVHLGVRIYEYNPHPYIERTPGQ